MKTTSLDLSHEDLLIWLAIDRGDLFLLARDLDRADADLMQYAQQHRARMGCFVGQLWVQYRGKSFL
jgi:hypothetical protein